MIRSTPVTNVNTLDNPHARRSSCDVAKRFVDRIVFLNWLAIIFVGAAARRLSACLDASDRRLGHQSREVTPSSDVARRAASPAMPTYKASARDFGFPPIHDADESEFSSSSTHATNGFVRRLPCSSNEIMHKATKRPRSGCSVIAPPRITGGWISRCHSNAEFHHRHKLIQRFRICQRFLVGNRATVDNVANRQFDNLSRPSSLEYRTLGRSLPERDAARLPF